mmetsp:Transcript_19809/g.30592  ORF Transcript_19809/g.30592 Transcript_19809/m.30592 type:complete len:593 (-) Transcript_19809:160-1938(-)|eukprot:CAMPEP_0195289612 /NCGR_PEP_ID=MMETSP0707-20130614/5817_1 /TAXON_ID=33640 /ORGANISM="Asterionellopsis glacialis, Strain CCMP134" /LENGTH=592 /DNA_ID=CAMNT_0040349635 /DNA_START=61 /DNA_END=1839 /DNA_ORIENTATION=-
MADTASVARSMGGGGASATGGGGGSVMGGTGDYVDLHELSKGWKAAIARAKDPVTRHEAQVKNDRGNLPLHSAASFRAPLEVTEALLEAYPEAASTTNNYGNLALHFTAWKKGPLDAEKLLLKVYPEGAACKNNHGNLPLHYAAHYNAPLEVVEALYNAYPEGASQKNNDNNTPLDLAIADGASPNVVALLQGKTIPPTDDEVLEGAKGRCERMEKELQRHMEKHDDVQEDVEAVLSLLMDIRDGQPSSLYSTGIDPAKLTDMESLLEQARRSAEESKVEGGDEFGLQSAKDEDEEAAMIEDALLPPDDDVEIALSQIIGLDSVKNQFRGLRRTLEMNQGSRTVPRHFALVGNPGTGKTYVSELLLPLFFKIGAVKTPNVVIAGRDELVDRKSEARTVIKTRKVLEKASGGVLFVDEAYALLPSTARPRNRDHGAAALREIARSLPSGNPCVILAGYPLDLQRVLGSEIGFKGHFLTRIELPDPPTTDIARMFMTKLHSKGLVPADGVTVEYLADLLDTNTDEEWRAERNGRISDLLLMGVRLEMKKRLMGDDNVSRMSQAISPRAQRMPAMSPEDVIVTVEDVQNAIVNGM